MGLLSEDEIASRTRMIGPWDYDPEDKMLVRETTFKDFKEAVEFINKLAEVAEKINHHPDMTVCEYNRVIVATTTHDEEEYRLFLICFIVDLKLLALS